MRLRCLALALGLAGCVTTSWRNPCYTDWRLGHALDRDPQARPDPHQRVEDIVACRALPDNYESQTGLDALRYPTWRLVGQSADYVQLGRDYEALGSLGAASVAYWAALRLVGSSVASRPDRERVRKAAFEALARVAEKRGQPTWSQALALCGAAAGVYLDSDQAHEDARAFRQALREMEENQERAEKIANRARDALSWQAMGMQLKAQTGQMSLQDMANSIGSLSSQSSDIESAERGVLGEIGQQSMELADTLGDDVAAVEAHKSFLGNQIVFYLATSRSPADTVAVVEQFAARNGWAGVSAAVAAIADRNRPSAPELRALAAELHRLEVEATRRERGRHAEASR